MFIGIWVTTSCNLSCAYCYEGGEKEISFMSEETANHVLEFIQQRYKGNISDPLVIEFHGGEPLMNYEIIRYMIGTLESLYDKDRVLFGITTNGLLLDEEIIGYLSEKMTYGFSISIDGDRETHDLYRVDHKGHGSYVALSRKIPCILKYRPDARARMTYRPETISKLSHNVIHLLTLGFTNIVSAPDYGSPCWLQEDMDVLLEEMHKLRIYYYEHQLQKKKVFIPGMNDVFKKKGKCGGGSSNFHIMPNGDIYPCSYGTGLDELLLGTVYDEELNVSKLEALNRMNAGLNPQCLGCSGIESCLCTRCKIINRVIMGEYLKPIPAVCAIENIKQQFWKNNSR